MSVSDDSSGSVSESAEQREEWLETLVERLGQDTAPVRRLVRPRRGKIAVALSNLVSARNDHEASPPLDADVQSLVDLIGFDVAARGGSARAFADLMERAQAAGLERQALSQVVQAYVRAVGRIVAVEIRLALEMLDKMEPERRSAIGTELLETLLPSSVRGFDLLHRAMLQEAALEAREGVTLGITDLNLQAVGMADLVGSTAYLAQAEPRELERMVDAMFAAGQAATGHRNAHVLKYVGDGVFIASHDVVAVADAVAEVVGRLESELPLRARGGISYGWVVHRAGDIFGHPVNLSQALTKAATPGTVLLSESAAELLPRDRRGRTRSRRLPNPAFGEQRVATLRSSATVPPVG
jgi:class 3 adenylate cyclase